MERVYAKSLWKELLLYYVSDVRSRRCSQSLGDDLILARVYAIVRLISDLYQNPSLLGVPILCICDTLQGSCKMQYCGFLWLRN